VLVLTMNLITAFALFLSVRASDDPEAELPTWITVCLYVNMAFMCFFVLHELYPMIELFQETWYLRLQPALQFSVASKFVCLCYSPVCTQVGSFTEDIQTNQEADPKTSWWSRKRGR
jgi:hypothetical protein